LMFQFSLLVSINHKLSSLLARRGWKIQALSTIDER